MKRITYIILACCLLLACSGIRLAAQDINPLLIPQLAAQLVPPGQSDDAPVRYAIAGLVSHASKDDQSDIKTRIAMELCHAIQNAKHDEVKDFLLIQLQYVAGEESVETVKVYLSNPRLCDPAIRILVRINNETANQAMFEALTKANPATLISLVQGLGYNKYLPALDAITDLVEKSDLKLQKTALFALSQIASLDSKKLLAEKAAASGYIFEQTNATEAYFIWLRAMNQSGQQNFVAEISRKLIKKLKTPLQTSAKCSALELYTLSSGEKAISEVLNALKDSDVRYREAALQYSVNIASPKMDEELLKLMKKTSPGVKEQIIRFFGAKNNRSALSAIFELLNFKKESEEVIATAIAVAGQMGNENAVIPIIQVMIAKNTPFIVNTGEATLLSINSPEVVTEVVNVIPQATSEAKAAFINILAQKKATSHHSVIFENTLSDDKLVRTAAYNALKQVVSNDNTEALASLLTFTLEPNEIAAIQDALFFAVKDVGNQELQSKILVELLDKAERKELYFKPLALVGGESALKIVLDSFENGDEKVRTAATDALIEWNGDEAISALLMIAKSQKSRLIFDKMLMGYVSKINRSTINNTQKLLLLRKALDIAITPTQKRTILNRIAETYTFVGLMIVGKYMDDPNADVRYTASQAVISTTLNNKEYYGKEVTTLLHKAIAQNSNSEAEYQKQAIQKHIESLPQDDGFVSLFNGKDLTGWKGLVGNPIARSKMSPSVLATRQQKADDIMRRDWKVENGLLVFDGKGYDNLCTKKQYGDFEMYVDWKIGQNGDAGIYLRGSPQVQIWDTSQVQVGAQVGSGALYNNQKHPSSPLVVADNLINEWNSFHIQMIGEVVTVYLNGQLVTDHVIMENYWNRKQPIFPTDQIELQAHGSRVEYRDIYIREIHCSGSDK